MLFLFIKYTGNNQHKWTAGVYLLMRSSPLIEYSSTVLLLCLWIGAITTVFSSLIGLFQQDIKKVIAYSTMSQLARECIFYSITLRYQTIFVKIVFNMLNKFIITINSQITKAHDYLYSHYNVNIFNSSLIKWLYYCMDVINKHVIMSVRWNVNIIWKSVGISEAIRLILVFVKLNIINLTFIFKYYIFIILGFAIPTSASNINYLKLNFEAAPKNKGFYKNYLDSDSTDLDNDSDNDSFEDDINAEQENIIPNNNINNDLSFKQWLAGLIDGDGYFLLTKKGYNSCEITMDARDKKALYLIKHRYGGTVKQISNANAFKYKLRHKAGLILLINDINGFLRNPTRLLQMNKLCVKFNIQLKYPEKLSFNDGWLSGLIDSDGSIYFNESSGQVFIAISQRNKFLLEPLIDIYGGRVDILSPKIEAFKYVVYRKAELYNLIDNYFSKYPLRTEKMKRVNLIKEFYLKRVSKNNKDIIKLNEWVKFKDRWDKFQD